MIKIINNSNSIGGCSNNVSFSYNSLKSFNSLLQQNNNNHNIRSFYKSSLFSLKNKNKKSNNNNDSLNNSNHNNNNDNNINKHVNKPSVSKEESLFQIFQKYEFNNKELSTQSIWLPFLKTQYYDFNPYPADTLKMSQTQISTINSLSKFKDLLKRELRALNKNKSDSDSNSDSAKIKSNNNINSISNSSSSNNEEIFTVEKSMFFINNNCNNINNIKIKSSDDFLNKDFNNQFLNYLNINFDDNNGISGSDNDKFNNSKIWAQQILPNSFKIKRLPLNSSNMDIAKECFNYLYPILSYLHYYYGDNFHYSIQAFNNSKEDPLNQDSDSEKEFKNKIKRVKKSLEILIESTRKRLFSRLVQVSDKDQTTIGIAFNNINNLNGLEFLKDKEKAYYIIQILFNEGNSNDIYLSIGKTSWEEGRGWSYPLPFNQGVVPIERDQIPPSRAYKKLIESFQTLGTTPSPSSTIVELGSAPGGWTSILDRLYDSDAEKLKIFTVDRSKLDSQFKSSKTITHTFGDGTKITPSNISGLNCKVDWLLNDMAIPANKSLEVLEKWIKNKYTTYFVWALKFDVIEDSSLILNDCHQLMKNYNISNYRIKHMVYQGNEIMLIGKIE